MIQRLYCNVTEAILDPCGYNAIVYLIIECLRHGVVDVGVDGRVDVAHSVAHHLPMGNNTLHNGAVILRNQKVIQNSESKAKLM